MSYALANRLTECERRLDSLAPDGAAPVTREQFEVLMKRVRALEDEMTRKSKRAFRG